VVLIEPPTAHQPSCGCIGRYAPQQPPLPITLLRRRRSYASRRECNGAGTTQGGRTMSNDKAFLLYVGGSLAVVRFALVAWLD
jgi:hypothetical protein